MRPPAMSRLLVAVLALCAIPVSLAYPDKPVQYVIPFSPGGESDVAARLQAEVFSTKYKQEMVVVNKPGAGGALAWSQLNSMPGDGHTIVGVNLPHIVLQPLEAGTQFKTEDITPSGYNEGTFVIKRAGTYYFMWSENDTRDENYRVAYATGPSPTGPWTKQGVILSKDLSLGIKGTGHHSVVHVPNTDDWYIVYHRFAIPGGDGTHREVTIDRLRHNPDGTIAPVVPTLESIAPVR